MLLKNYGISTTGARRWKSITIFESDWGILSEAIDRELPNFDKVTNVLFYRAMNGIMCAPTGFEPFVSQLVDLDHPRLVLAHIHMGLNIQAP